MISHTYTPNLLSQNARKNEKCLNHNYCGLKTTVKHLLNAEQLNATRREFRASSGQTKKGGALQINHNKIPIIIESKQETSTIHKTSLWLRKQNRVRLDFKLAYHNTHTYLDILNDSCAS